MLVRPGSDCIRPHEDLCKYDSIPVMFPVTFPVTFHFRPHNPHTSVGSRSVPRSDRSKISDFPRFVGRVRSRGFRGRSRVGPRVKPPKILNLIKGIFEKSEFLIKSLYLIS